MELAKTCQLRAKESATVNLGELAVKENANRAMREHCTNVMIVAFPWKHLAILLVTPKGF